MTLASLSCASNTKTKRRQITDTVKSFLFMAIRILLILSKMMIQ